MQKFILAAATVATLTTALPAAAQFQKPEDAVKYRQSAMFVIGQHFGRVGAMANGKAPYDAAAAAANIEVVAAMAKLPFAGFVEGTSSTEKGKAKADIWAKRAKFDEGAKAMQDAIVKLVAASKSNTLDTLKPAFGDVGKTCKGCHDDFRNQ